jgi:hypothetical protein
VGRIAPAGGDSSACPPSAIPAPVRPIVKSALRRMNAKRLHGHGIGRLPRALIAELAIRDINALAVVLGDKPLLTGDRPCGADAFVFGIVTAHPDAAAGFADPSRAAATRQSRRLFRSNHAPVLPRTTRIRLR